MRKYERLDRLNIPWEKLKDAKVLVTGGNGMIASAFVEAVHEVSESKDLHTHLYVLCRKKERAEKRFEALLGSEDFDLVIQDVIDPLQTDEEFDYIVHAASSAHPNAFNNTPVDVMKANFIGTMNMLEYAKTCPKTRFLYVSSSEIYGENERGVEIFSEDTPGIIDHMRFRACYPESKRASETLSFCYQKQYGSDVVIVRPAFIYGRDIVEDNTRADVYFLRQALNHEDIVMYSDGSQIRSYCYVTDCVSGMLFALLLGESGQIYNIGNSTCVVTMKEYAQKLADHGGIRLIMDPSVKPEGVVMLKTTKMILDTSKLEALGWKPEFTLDEGFADIFGE